MTITITKYATCSECGFGSSDIALVNNHSCDVTTNGGRCEDFPACGHEAGDCNGQLYGSDEAIKAQVHRDWATGHGMCDHENGLYECEDQGFDEDDFDDDHDAQGTEDAGITMG